MMKPLPPVVFIIFMIVILSLGIGFSIALHFFVKIPVIPAIYQGPVTTKPISLFLNLSSPDNNKLVFEESLLVQGQTIPHALVLLSLENEDKIIDVDNMGNFSITIKLSSDVNQFTAAVFDNLGNSKKEERIVYFSKDKL